MHCTGKKFLHSGLEGNKYNNNKSFNHATLNHAVYYVTLRNTELGHLSENYSTSSDQDQILSRMYLGYWQVLTHLNDFMLGQEIINLGPVAPGAC